MKNIKSWDVLFSHILLNNKHITECKNIYTLSKSELFYHFNFNNMGYPDCELSDTEFLENNVPYLRISFLCADEVYFEWGGKIKGMSFKKNYPNFIFSSNTIILEYFKNTILKDFLDFILKNI